MIKAFVVCLYDWDYRCDREMMIKVLAVFETLEDAIQYSLSYKIRSNDEFIEIEQFEGQLKCCRYTKYGQKLE